MIPRAWTLYRVFCFAMVILNIVVMVGALRIPELGSSVAPELPLLFWRGLTQLLIVIGLILTIANAILPFLPRNPISYSIHLANLVVSAAGVITAPFCVPLLIMFRSPEAQRYFGIASSR